MVDVAVHKQNERGIIEEILPSTGGPFGGISVDRAFEAFLESIISREILDIFQNSYFEDFKMLFDEFEAKKRGYMHRKVFITIPLELERLLKKKSGIGLSSTLKKNQYTELVEFKRNKLRLEPSLFNSFFQPAIDGIIKTIQNVLANQLCADLTHIIMVGGLSGSKIIQNALQETFPKCQFLIPDYPELAVLKGAVYFGHLPNAVSGRFARFTYGINICRRFIPGEDLESKRIIVNEVARCQDVFLSIVQRGDQIQTATEYSCVTMLLKQNQHIATIYVSDNKKPKYIDDEGCKPLGSLTITALHESKENAEIEQTIIFGETALTFRVSQCGSDRCWEISFDLLDEASVPDFLHT